jgi:hypothetical protein
MRRSSPGREAFTTPVSGQVQAGICATNNQKSWRRELLIEISKKPLTLEPETQAAQLVKKVHKRIALNDAKIAFISAHLALRDVAEE